jgi:hypothetical protein
MIPTDPDQRARLRRPPNGVPGAPPEPVPTDSPLGKVQHAERVFKIVAEIIGLYFNLRQNDDEGKNIARLASAIDMAMPSFQRAVDLLTRSEAD